MTLYPSKEPMKSTRDVEFGKDQSIEQLVFIEIPSGAQATN